MKKLLLMAAVMLSSVGAFAQHAVGSFTLQPKVGINIANITNNGDYGKARVDFAGGLEGEYQATDIFSLSAGLMYSRQGFKTKDVNVAGYTISGDSWTPSYLNVPVLANVYVVPGLAVKLGVQPGFMIDKDDAEDVNTFDLSIPVGLSYEYNNFVLDGRYNWGVTKINKHSIKGADDTRNSVFQITLGYKFSL
ncbi:porin family protein [Hallella mizrahii]|uniref:PorT family protein n=1 Tax=Hallella mizrahii TaxID=2606637 RepID=A0A7K0KI35_9BACT|nr:porin family protein [Hallella mizrahii]MST85110.1 PorT family protein [Hallella mizrahii]